MLAFFLLNQHSRYQLTWAWTINSDHFENNNKKMTNNKKKDCQIESSCLTNPNPCHMSLAQVMLLPGAFHFLQWGMLEICVGEDCSCHFMLWRATKSGFQKEWNSRHLFSLAFVVLKLWKWGVLDLVGMIKSLSLAKIYQKIIFNIFSAIQL